MVKSNWPQIVKNLTLKTTLTSDLIRLGGSYNTNCNKDTVIGGIGIS